MQQLSLEVRLADHALFDTFFPGSNAQSVHALRNCIAQARASVIWLRGAAETGKSHLLQACIGMGASEGLRSVYLPLGADFDWSPAALEGLDDMELVCIDDVDSIAGDRAWERGLFQLFEGLRQSHGRLILSAVNAPRQCGFVLPDLVSRFSSGPIFLLAPLTDQEKLRALQLRAEWRGMKLPDETARYLIQRVDRGSGRLFKLLDDLDREALAAQKKLTIPFVRAVLSK